MASRCAIGFPSCCCLSTQDPLWLGQNVLADTPVLNPRLWLVSGVLSSWLCAGIVASSSTVVQPRCPIPHASPCLLWRLFSLSFLFFLIGLFPIYSVYSFHYYSFYSGYRQLTCLISARSRSSRARAKPPPGVHCPGMLLPPAAYSCSSSASAYVYSPFAMGPGCLSARLLPFLASSPPYPSLLRFCSSPSPAQSPFVQSPFARKRTRYSCCFYRTFSTTLCPQSTRSTNQIVLHLRIRLSGINSSSSSGYHGLALVAVPPAAA